MIEGDRVRVSVRVPAPAAEAFTLFTEQIDQWWRRGRAFRVGGQRRGVLHIEPFVGGRLYEQWEGRDGRDRVVATGEVLRWEPPALLQLKWRNVNFRGDEATLVTVSFEDQGAHTLLTLVHEGWAGIRPDHPARHGKPPAAFLRELGLWWGSLLRALREHSLP
ncbi:MAG: SRPBCC domain-containing protein [Alphaproteobacteria bacterium]|nr:SRPBCC domain-containing protein [Alphaproteobacteria bacterium]MCB9791556.1 SRPBCC domain-containing protein [Alphaproteobacteria bacterium]